MTQDANFPRAPIAAKAGFRSAFAVPLQLGSDILGVMEFPAAAASLLTMAR